MTAALALVVRFWRPLAALALLALAVWAYVHWRDTQRGIGAAAERKVWEQAVQRQKDEARATLEDARRRVEIAEGAAAALRQEQDLKDTQNAKTVADLELRLAHAGRLRDPNAKPARCGGSGASPGPQGTASASAGRDDAAEAPGLLSAELSGLLRNLTAEADRINIAYESSREDARNLRTLLASCGPAQAQP